MAFPVALIPVVAKGLVYFRRALTIYRMVEEGDKIVNLLSIQTNSDLIHHRLVAGENGYLFLLGKAIVSNLETQDRDKLIPAKDIEDLILTTLVHPLFIQSSPDAQSRLNAFLYALGAVLQRRESDTYSVLTRYMDELHGLVTITEPVYDMLTSEADILTNSTVEIFEATGMTKQEATWLIERVKTSDSILDPWFAASQKATEVNPRFHKSSLILATMLEGAKLLVSTRTIGIKIAKGTSPLTLNTSFLIENPVSTPPSPSTIRSINLSRAMVDAYERQWLTKKGLQPDREYGMINRNDAVAKEEILDSGIKVVTYQVSPTATVYGVNSSQISDVVTSQIKRLIIDRLSSIIE